MIFKTERDSFRVLDQNGQVRLVKPHQITLKRDSDRAVAADAEGHELHVHDNVKEVDGEVRCHQRRKINTRSAINIRCEEARCCTFINHSLPFFTIEITPRTAVSSSPGVAL